MRIEILKEDIAYASRQDRWACAIVRAIQRQNPDALFVRADTKVIAFSSGGHRYVYNTPPAAIEKVIKPFDEGRPIQPATFSLVAPTVSEVRKLTPEKKKILRDHERVRRHKERNRVISRTHNRFCEVPGE